MMNKILFHTKANYYLTLSIAFLLPIARLTPIFIALMLLNWIVEGDFKNKFQTVLKNKFALLFIAFYLMHLVGLIYTQNINSGLFDIQVKFSLLIFPIMIASRPIENAQLKNVFFALIAGCATSLLIMLAWAIYTYFALGENNFFSSAYSFLLHPSYLSMYLNFAIAWILINVHNNTFIQNRFSKLIAATLILFFSFIIVMLSSKAGLITMILEYFCFLIYFIISLKKYVIGISGILIILVSIYLVMRFVPEVNGRISRAYTAVTSSTTNQADAESTAVRLLVWKAANQVISENLITGVGTGDAKDALMKEYEKRGMTGALEKKLNSHNEFYQVFLSLGLIGFIVLLANLLFPLFFAFKTSNVIYLAFLIIIIINFFTESMLETEAGVMFYAFFNSLLCFNSAYFNPKSQISNSKSV